MAYSDPNFNVTSQENVVGANPSSAVSLGTSTANSTNTLIGTAGSQVNGSLQFPVFKNPTKVLGLRVYIKTAPTAGNTGLALFFLNGTSTMGTAVIGTNTAGAFVDAVMTALSTDSHGVETGAALMTSTSSNEILVTATVTSTASAIALGSYAVDAILRNYFPG